MNILTPNFQPRFPTTRPTSPTSPSFPLNFNLPATVPHDQFIPRQNPMDQIIMTLLALLQEQEINPGPRQGYATPQLIQDLLTNPDLLREIQKNPALMAWITNPQNHIDPEDWAMQDGASLPPAAAFPEGTSENLMGILRNNGFGGRHQGKCLAGVASILAATEGDGNRHNLYAQGDAALRAAGRSGDIDTRRLAKNFGPYLETMSYQSIGKTNSLQPGDIVVFGHKRGDPSHAGHIAIVGQDGKLYSDAKDSREGENAGQTVERLAIGRYSDFEVFRKAA